MPSHPSAYIAANNARRREFLWITKQLTMLNLLRVFCAAIILLVFEKLNIPVDKLKKLTPMQRALLAMVTILAGGAIIVFSLIHQNYGLALVIMFVLGWAVSEISRL